MKNLLILGILAVCLNAKEIPEKLKTEFWKSRSIQLQISDQYKQLQLLMPQLEKQYNEMNAVVEANKKKIKDFCESEKLEFKDSGTDFSCEKPSEKKVEEKK